MKDKDIVEEKAQKLLETTAAFCKEYLDDDYRQLCEKLIGKMARKRNVPFLSGRLEIWAAAFVYAYFHEKLAEWRGEGGDSTRRSGRGIPVLCSARRK
jgi:hypothetical protein